MLQHWKARGIPAVLALLLTQISACGYLIFEERAGQPPGEIDWAVAGLNAVGLLFGIIPGVIAFAVDFSTGCIYLPTTPEQQHFDRSAAAVPPGVPAGWTAALMVAPFASDAEVSVALTRYLTDRGYLPSAIPAVQISRRHGSAVAAEVPRRML